MLSVILAGAVCAAPAPFPRTKPLPPASVKLPAGLYQMHWSNSAALDLTLYPSGDYQWGNYVGTWTFASIKQTLSVHERPMHLEETEAQHWMVTLKVFADGSYRGEAYYPGRETVSNITVIIKRRK